MDSFISTFLPLHEGPVKSAFVLVDQSKLDSLHLVFVMLAVLFPDHESLVLDIAVLEVSLT